MARKLRRHRVSPGLASTMTSALLVCVAVAIALLGHIRFKGELHRLDREIAGMERALRDQRKTNARLQADYERLVSPLGLEARLREMRLPLVVPGDGARVVLREPVVPPAARPEADAPDRALVLGGTSGAVSPSPLSSTLPTPWN